MGRRVVSEGVRVLGRVPEGSAVGLVVEQAPGEDVGVHAGGAVHGVGACGTVDDGPFGETVDGGVGPGSYHCPRAV